MGVRLAGWCEEEFGALKSNGAWRELRTLTYRDGATITIDGKDYVNFGSNDYLGLAQHPKLVEAAIEAVRRWGTGAQASRLVTGNLSLHQDLERATARFKQTESCLVFPSGYQANVGLLTALFMRGDVIILDKGCHASLVDGARLSGAQIRVFPHNNLAYLEKLWSQTRGARRRAVVVESVYSVDGNLAPLPELSVLVGSEGSKLGVLGGNERSKLSVLGGNERSDSRPSRHSQTFLIIDDAHATGVLGPQGQGSKAHFGLHANYPIEMVWTGTYSKALGSQGGFVCGSRPLRDYLINHARAFIYSTGLAPAATAAALRAIELLQSDTHYLAALKKNIAVFNPQALSPIFPVVLGSNAAVLKAQADLGKQGFWVPALRYPTVKKGSEQLRLSLRADLEFPALKRLVQTLPQYVSAAR